MESHVLSHLPLELSTLHYQLFTQVKNAGELRQRLINASKMEGTEGEEEREKVDFCFVDAQMITSRVHLLTAIHQAIISVANGTMRTKTPHSEILYALSPGTNITDAIKRFGLSSTTADLILVHVCPPQDVNPTPSQASPLSPTLLKTIASRMRELVSGRPASLTLLDDVTSSPTNWKEIKKVYKLNGDSDSAVLSKSKSVGPQIISDVEKRIVDDLVISTVASKSVSS